MSVVVAIKDNDKIWVGCDSQVTQGYTKRTLLNKNNYKIFKPSKENDVILGICGYLRDRDILYCVEEYIDELSKLKNEVNYRYIVTKLVPKLFKILSDNDRIIKDEKKLQRLESILIFAYKNQLYKIDSDGAVTEIDDYIAIGSGEALAIGYLNQSKDENKKQALIESIKASCKSDLYVNFPIVIMNTKDDEIEVIKG